MPESTVATIHLTLTGYDAGRVLCGAHKGEAAAHGDTFQHAVYADLTAPTLCPACLAVWNDDSDDEPAPASTVTHPHPAPKYCPEHLDMILLPQWTPEGTRYRCGGRDGCSHWYVPAPVANPHLPTGTTVPPLCVRAAQIAEATQAGRLERAAAQLAAAGRALLARDPWLSLEFRTAVILVEHQLQAATVAHTHRAAVEGEYQRVQQAEDARIGWTIACEGEVA